MRTTRQRLLFAIAVVSLGLSAVFWLIEFIAPTGTFDFYPAFIYVAAAVSLIAWIPKIRHERAAVSLGWGLRLSNLAFVTVCAGMVFVWLPMNSQTDAPLALTVAVNSVLVLASVVVWWVAHRQIRLALLERKDG